MLRMCQVHQGSVTDVPGARGICYGCARGGSALSRRWQVAQVPVTDVAGASLPCSRTARSRYSGAVGWLNYHILDGAGE